MSVRNGLLALLTERPKYGYQLRAEFEQRTGGTWPLNIGQVYTTLNRLERDGLVVATESAEGDEASDDRRRYALTSDGRAESDRWFTSAVLRSSAPRDELAIKLALAVTVPGVDVQRLIQAQRVETMQTLQSYTRLKAHTDPSDVAWQLSLDSLVFQAEAELRWLDHCESSLLAVYVDKPAREGESESVRTDTGVVG